MGTEASTPENRVFCARPMGARKPAEIPPRPGPGWWQTSAGPEPARLIGYVRVSTEDQALNGVSLEAQRGRIEAYAAAHGLHVAHVEADEGVSAKTTRKRPGLQRALCALTRGDADGLVAVKLDRLSRSTRDVLDLVATAERERWALHSIEERLDTSSPHGRFVVTVLAALAQLEREQVAQRTKAAMAELRRQGRRTSRFARFGYRLEGDRVVADEGELRILARILDLRRKGLGPHRLAEKLNREIGPNPRTGRAWTYGGVKGILRTVDRHGPPTGAGA